MEGASLKAYTTLPSVKTLYADDGQLPELIALPLRAEGGGGIQSNSYSTFQLL